MMKKIIKDVRLAVLFLTFKRRREWCFILPLLFLSLVFLTNAGAKETLVIPEGPAESVEAVEVEKITPEFKPSEDGPAPRPNHPPFDQIPAEDMPEAPSEADKGVDSSGPEGVCYPDPVTGETVCDEAFDLDQWTDEIVRVPSFDGADGGSGVMEESDTFGETVFVDRTLVSVSSRKNHPWRMNVKLVMRFRTASGGSRYSQCSGSMIDAETVQTAGHCVFNWSLNQGWAREIWVYPAWDGSVSQDDPPPSIINHYGYGHSTGSNMAAAAGWVSIGKFDDDLGLVGIDRAVGTLTGWFLRSRGGDCNDIKAESLQNASYPGPEGAHTGRDMYYWYGHFDSCPGNQLHLNTTPGFNSQGVGGMSGSSAYRISGSNRYIRAVASTSDRAYYINYCRLWNWWIDWTNSNFIPQVRGSSFDLQGLDVNAGPSTIQAGSKTTLLNHLATNPTNGSSSYKTRTYRVYLSTNDNISTSDTLLSTQSYYRSFVKMQNVRVNMGQVTIPSNTPAGNYFIGVVYDSSTDGNYGNNDTDGWDAVPIKVTRPSVSADVTNLWTVFGDLTPGGDAKLWAYVKNTGSVTLPSTARVYYYVTGPSSYAAYVGYKSVGGQTSGISKWYDFIWNIPASAKDGTYKYKARVWDTATAKWLGAEKCCVSFIVKAPTKPSADVTSLWTVSGDLTPGGDAKLWAQVKNTGSVTLPSAAKVWYYVTGPSSYAAYVGSKSVGGLTSGTSDWYDFIWNIPASAKPGTYQYKARVWDSATSTWLGAEKCCVSFIVKIPGKPSAEVTRLWPPGTIGCGGTAKLWAEVKNTGTVTLPYTARAYYYVRRPDYVVNGYVGSVSVGGLAPGATKWYSLSWKVPYRGEEGTITYSYWARVKDTGTGTWLGAWKGPQVFYNLCIE